MDEKNNATIVLKNIDAEQNALVEKMEKNYPQMTNKFKEICAQQYITFLKKQNDYGPNNIAMNTNLETEQDMQLAMTGLITRMNDKMSRLINLIIRRKDSPNNESTDDSFMDISVYGIIARIVRSGNWAK